MDLRCNFFSNESRHEYWYGPEGRSKRLTIYLRCLTKSIVNLVKTFQIVKLEMVTSIRKINQAGRPTPKRACILLDPATRRLPSSWYMNAPIRNFRSTKHTNFVTSQPYANLSEKLEIKLCGNCTVKMIKYVCALYQIIPHPALKITWPHLTHLVANQQPRDKTRTLHWVGFKVSSICCYI